MKKQSIIGESLLQTGIALFIVANLLLLTWLIIVLLEKYFQISFSITNESLSLTITVLVTICIALYVYNSQRSEKEKEEINTQLDLLEVLKEELTFLEKNLESYKEVFSKEKHYPLYELWEIDLSIYFNGLGHKINNIETIELKKNLMIIKDKLLIVKNMKDESRKEEERGTEKLIQFKIKCLRKGIISRIDDDLLQTIKKSKELLNKILELK